MIQLRQLTGEYAGLRELTPVGNLRYLAQKIASYPQTQLKDKSAFAERRIHRSVAPEKNYQATFETQAELSVQHRKHQLNLPYSDWLDKDLRANQISSRIQQAVESSKQILEWPDNWDDEGSKHYEEATWNRAVNWLKKVAIVFRKQHGVWIDAPRILPAPEGSIDIHWKNSKRELLINFPESPEEPVDYYGSSAQQDIIKGKLDISQSSEWMLIWLTR